MQKNNPYDKIAAVYDFPLMQYVYWWEHKRALFDLQPVIGPCARILDIGCATGKFAKKLRGAHPHINVTLLDASANMIERSKKACPFAKALCKKFLHAHLPQKSYDLITIIDALYCLENPKKAIETCAQLLALYGYLYIIAPQSENFLHKILIAYTKLFPTEKTSVHIPAKEIECTAKESGLLLIKKYKKYGQWFLLFQKH
ncbi:MAG: hypothetical protein UU76_C0004G0015 [Parcubacteria group bacterium GW2011_GWC1_41_7]|nr:MAG: hypothetical protein UU76_C0004G0015 [Parcubacteria group bacterium GW2011_GWC1_41_7]